MSKKISFFLFIFLVPYCAIAQERDAIPVVVDSLYREDQIYIGFTYDLVLGQPDEIKSSQFSGGFHLGFIRDFPLNERRNVALGLGLGWSIDSYGQNLFLGEGPDSGETVFDILDRDVVDFDTNRFTMHSIDVPLQFRWRTSTPESYKFWRVYGGLRPSYIYYFKSKFVQDENVVRQSDVPELDRLNLGATFTFGYNTFNFYFYYSINSLFDDATVRDEALELRTFQVGLMFFLL